MVLQEGPAAVSTCLSAKNIKMGSATTGRFPFFRCRIHQEPASLARASPASPSRGHGAVFSPPALLGGRLPTILWVTYAISSLITRAHRRFRRSAACEALHQGCNGVRNRRRCTYPAARGAPGRNPAQNEAGGPSWARPPLPSLVLRVVRAR